MSLAKGLVCSIGCGAVGAAVWAGVTYGTGWSAGLVAIIVGGAAGFGMAQGNQGRGGHNAGVLAAIVALVSILAGHFAAMQIVATRMISEATLTDDDAVDLIAEDIFNEMQAAGETFEYEEWNEDEQWPTIVQYKAETRWAAMSEESRQAFLAAKQAEYQEEARSFAPVLALVFFLRSLVFSWKSWVIVGLGVSTAYKIGSSDMKAEAAARGMVTDEPAADLAAASPGATPHVAAASPAPAKPRRSEAAQPSAGDETVSSGYRLPAMRDPDADNLPSIDEILRRHAATQDGDKGAEAA